MKKCVYSDYVHTDRLGSVVNLTDQYGRVPAQIDYDDWGKVTAYQSLDISGGYRTVLPEITYAGHQYDDVLGMYYAKARMYDAENRRFAAVDPVKGQITEPMTMVQYLYVVDDPLRWVDLLGQASGDLYVNGVKVKYVYKNGEVYASMKNMMSALGGNFYSAKREMKYKTLPDGSLVFWEEDVSPYYYSEISDKLWVINKNNLSSDTPFRQDIWRTSVLPNGDISSKKTGDNLDFIKFVDATSNGDMIAVDINQLLRWYYKQYKCVPTIEFEIGNGGLWERDYRPTNDANYWLYVAGGGTNPISLFSPTGTESVAIVPKESFRDYYYSTEYGYSKGLGWLFADSTGRDVKYDMAFNVVDHFYNEWKINNYSTDDAVEYISIEKIITIDSYDTNDGLSYAGSYVTQYIIRPVYKTRGDKQFFPLTLFEITCVLAHGNLLEISGLLSGICLVLIGLAISRQASSIR